MLWEKDTNVETLVHLSKKSQTSHIEVDVEFGEGEGQFSLKKVKQRAEARKPKEKVTYKMIKDGYKILSQLFCSIRHNILAIIAFIEFE